MMKYIMGIAASAALIYYTNNYTFRVKNLEISSDRIPEAFHGYRILHISDLHNTNYGTNNRRLIKAVEKIDPEVIFYTGDMIDKKTIAKSSFIHLASGLSKKYPSFYIYGNHEEELSREEKASLNAELDKAGIRFLENEKVLLKKNQEEISLYGLNLPNKFLRRTYDDQGELQLTREEIINRIGEPDHRFTILLSHNPLYFEAYAQYGADITFSGHVHGGMIRVPFAGGLLSPDRSFWPKYDKGHYAHRGRSLVVSPGIGGAKLRMLNPPMLYHVKLVHKSA